MAFSGSHVTNVFRRLQRVCRFYGQDPVFIYCSATVANPKEHAEDLLEKDVVLIDESGAPRSAKTFILYNPPIVNRELGIRQSALTPARNMMNDLIENKIQTIAFTTSRLNVEVLTKYLKDTFRGRIPGNDHYVTGYRGGYLAHLRRDKPTFCDTLILYTCDEPLSRQHLCDFSLTEGYARESRRILPISNIFREEIS